MAQDLLLFKNLAVNYFTFHFLHSVDNSSDEYRILELNRNRLRLKASSSNKTFSLCLAFFILACHVFHSFFFPNKSPFKIRRFPSAM